MKIRQRSRQRSVVSAVLLLAGSAFLMGQMCVPGGGSQTRYTLTVSTQGNGSVDPSGGQYNKGTEVTLTAAPAEGWSFESWQGDATGTSTQVTITLNRDMDVTAVFTQGDGPSATRALTVNAQGQGQVTLDPSGGTYAAGTQVKLTATANAGWHFDYWQGNLSGSQNPATVTMDQDKNVTAVFTENDGPPTTYALTVDTQGQGQVTLDPSGGPYDDGTAVELTATAESGWRFDHWQGSLSGSQNPATVTMDQDKNVTAVFVEDTPPAEQCSLSASIPGQGTVGLDPPGGSYEGGTTVTLTATAASGWRFDHWEGGATGSNNPVTVTVNTDTAVTAVFVQATASAIVFRATYDRLWDTDQQNPGYGILHSVMSGDGNRLAWAIKNNEGGALSILTMNVDGSGQTIIPAPAEVDSIWELTINYDGSRVFFRRWFNLLFKVEGGTITKILDTADVVGLGSIESIQCTRTGDYVYFLDDESNDNDIWRCTHTGGTAELVVNDTNIILHNGYPAAQVAEFSVSGDGGSLVFTTHAYWGAGGYVGRSEMFVQSGGGYTQLTTDGDEYSKSTPRISGDGSTIVFRRHNSWYSMNPDGANEIELGPAGHNLGGPKLAYDGSKMFYNDSQSGGSVLLNTDGSGRLNIFPAWNIVNIAIAATFHHAISDDATRVSFYTQYGILPESAAFYVGYLENPAVTVPSVANAPFVGSIAFSPGSFPRSSPDSVLLLHASISDPDGLADVTNNAVDELIGGVHASYDAVPAYFYHSGRDDGVSPDEVAGDGMFVSSASPGSKLDTLDEVTIRVSVMDSDKTITVADTVLQISP